MNINPPEGHRLLEFFFIACLKDDGEGSRLQPFIQNTFPSKKKPPSPHHQQEEDLKKKVLLFCFPDIENLTPCEHYAGETYQFVNTKADGTRMYGYCFRYLPRGNGMRWVQALCMVSYYPWFSFYASILEVASARLAQSFAELEVFLKRLIKQPIPSSKSTVLFRIPREGGVTEDVYTFVRSSDRDIDLSVLFSILEPNQVFALFISVLFERRILVVGSSFTHLSHVIRAAVSMIYPLQWEHIYIPILPQSLIDFVTAPMPYIVGVHSSCMNVLFTIRGLDEVVMLFLDEHRLSFFPEDLALFPSSDSKKILVNLNRCADSTNKIFESKAIAKIFSQVIATLFSSYQKYIVDKRFDVSAFVQSQSTSVQKFLEVFLMSQHADQLIRKMEKGTADQLDKEIASLQKGKSFATELFQSIKKNTRKLMSRGTSSMPSLDEGAIVDSIRHLMNQAKAGKDDTEDDSFEDSPPREPRIHSFLMDNQRQNRRYAVSAEIAQQMHTLGYEVAKHIQLQGTSAPARVEKSPRAPRRENPSTLPSRTSGARWVMVQGQIKPEDAVPPIPSPAPKKIHHARVFQNPLANPSEKPKWLLTNATVGSRLEMERNVNTNTNTNANANANADVNANVLPAAATATKEHMERIRSSTLPSKPSSAVPATSSSAPPTLASRSTAHARKPLAVLRTTTATELLHPRTTTELLHPRTTTTTTTTTELLHPTENNVSRIKEQLEKLSKASNNPKQPALFVPNNVK